LEVGELQRFIALRDSYLTEIVVAVKEHGQ
jgi:hypothetical protein